MPGESAYVNLDKAGAPADLAWQHSLRAVWERSSHACRMGEGGPPPNLTLPASTAVPGLLVQGGVKGTVLPNLQVYITPGTHSIAGGLQALRFWIVTNAAPGNAGHAGVA